MSNFEYNKTNGAFIIARSLFDSDIWFKPPDYLKIWIYLIGKSNHKARKYNGYFCDRGQYFCNYNELKDQLKYNIGYRKNKINESTVKNIMKYLRENQMIETTKKPRGILIKIVNYNDYQILANYEKTKNDNPEKPNHKPKENKDTSSINKNEKELKNSKMNMIHETQENPGLCSSLEKKEGERKNDYNRELSEKEINFIDDFIEWAYDPDNKFNQEKPIDETREYIENCIKKYGHEKIECILEDCKERYPWDMNECELSAYSQFWKEIQNLKHKKDYQADLEVKERVAEVIEYLEERSEKSFKNQNDSNLSKLIKNGISNNEIAKYLGWYFNLIEFDINKSILDNVTLNDIFSKEYWSQYLKVFSSSKQNIKYAYKESLQMR